MTEELLDDNLQAKGTLTSFCFPITFKFKIGTFANDFIATDSNEQTIAYVRQKMFKLKEAIKVYSNDSKSNLLYEIKADRIIDFNANYSFTAMDGEFLGSIGRKGMKSLWKASYSVLNADKEVIFEIKEENPWAKVMDTLFMEIPILGIFTGYMFNPKYLLSTKEGTPVIRLSKQASFFGRKFKLEKLNDMETENDENIMLAFMMMVLLERRRG